MSTIHVLLWHNLRCLGAAASVAAPMRGCRRQDVPARVASLVKIGWPEQHVPTDHNPYFGAVDNTAALARAIKRSGRLNPYMFAEMLRPAAAGTLTEQVRQSMRQSPAVDALEHARRLYAAGIGTGDADCLPRSVAVVPFADGDTPELDAATMGAVQAMVTHCHPDAVVASAWLAYMLAGIGLRDAWPPYELLRGFPDAMRSIINAPPAYDVYLRLWLDVVGRPAVDDAVARLMTAIDVTHDPARNTGDSGPIAACATGYVAMLWGMSRQFYPHPPGMPPVLYAPDSRGYTVLAWMAAAQQPLAAVMVGAALLGASSGELVPDTMFADGLSFGWVPGAGWDRD